MAGMSDLECRCVLPFYLKMMGLNALDPDAPVSAVRDAGRRTADGEVGWLLAAAWRPRVMGAWLACGRADRLQAELLASLETSQGTLTAPPLAISALHGPGAAAVPALRTYLRREREHRYGGASFIAAVLERLDAAPDGIPVSDQDRAAVTAMLSIARRLGETAPEAGPDAAT